MGRRRAIAIITDAEDGVTSSGDSKELQRVVFVSGAGGLLLEELRRLRELPHVVRADGLALQQDERFEAAVVYVDPQRTSDVVAAAIAEFGSKLSWLA